MRINDKILLENIEDYFNHKGLSPHLIDDIKEKVISADVGTATVWS
ncbi:hypothetical protein O9K65_10830, partial [Staphylococcus aureus]|nr:hypothetical protein [Staphylococcus aureus]